MLDCLILSLEFVPGLQSSEACRSKRLPLHFFTGCGLGFNPCGPTFYPPGSVAEPILFFWLQLRLRHKLCGYLFSQLLNKKVDFAWLLGKNMDLIHFFDPEPRARAEISVYRLRLLCGSGSTTLPPGSLPHQNLFNTLRSLHFLFPTGWMCCSDRPTSPTTTWECCFRTTVINAVMGKVTVIPLLSYVTSYFMK